MQIKFLCLNVWDGGRLMENMLAFIREQNPDILAIQEVYNGHDKSWEKRFRTMDVLIDEFGFAHNHFAPAFMETTEGKKLDQGNAVLSRFPITLSAVTFYDTPYTNRFFEVMSEEERLKRNFTTPRNLQHVEIDLGSSKLNIFNTQGIWGTDGEDNDRRLDMVSVISGQMKNKDNAILCGDFNLQLEGTKSFEILENSGVHSVFKGELINTFNMRQKDPNSGYATAIVDGVFVSPNIKVVEKDCPNIDVSDHLPLVTTLEI